MCPSVHRTRRVSTSTGGELFAHHPDAITAPEDFAVDHERRHAKDAGLLGLVGDALELATPLALDEFEKRSGLGATLLEHAADDLPILDIEFALPESLKREIVIFAE